MGINIYRNTHETFPFSRHLQEGRPRSHAGLGIGGLDFPLFDNDSRDEFEDRMDDDDENEEEEEEEEGAEHSFDYYQDVSIEIECIYIVKYGCNLETFKSFLFLQAICGDEFEFGNDPTIVTGHNPIDKETIWHWDTFLQRSSYLEQTIIFGPDFGTSVQDPLLSNQGSTPGIVPDRIANGSRRLHASRYVHPLITHAPIQRTQGENRPRWLQGLQSRPFLSWRNNYTLSRSLSQAMRSRRLGSTAACSNTPAGVTERFADAISGVVSGSPGVLQGSAGRDSGTRALYQRPHQQGNQNDLISNILSRPPLARGIQYRAISPAITRPRQRQRREENSQEPDASRGQETNEGSDADPAVHVDSSAQPFEANAEDSVGNSAPDNDNGQRRADDDLEPIDPEFLAALPPDLQQEVIENHERERQARNIARATEMATRNDDTQIADIIAMMPENLQAEALFTIQGDERNQDQEYDNGETGTGATGSLQEGRIVPLVFGEEVSNANTNRFPVIRVSNRMDSMQHLLDWARRDRDQTSNRDESNLAEEGPAELTEGEVTDRQSDADPLLDSSQIIQLLRLVRLPKWEGKMHLGRTIKNLTESSFLATVIFKQIFGLLRLPLSLEEYKLDELKNTLASLKFSNPEILVGIHEMSIDTRGAKLVLHSLGLEPVDESGSTSIEGVLSLAVVRRLLELLRTTFDRERRGQSVIMEVEVSPIYDTLKEAGIVTTDVMVTTGSNSIGGLEILLSFPLRHEILKSPLRGMALEVRNIVAFCIMCVMYIN